jgi:DNA-binding NtrC family response regulator
MAEDKKPSILLVEDEENLHEALKLNLELEGYEVSSAYDGVGCIKSHRIRIFRPAHFGCDVAGNRWYQSLPKPSGCKT